MAKFALSNLGDIAKKCGKGFYKWLGITSGSLGDIPGNHLRIGRTFLERGEYEEAIRRAKLSAWMRKSSPEPYALMVAAHAAMGKKQEAEQAYNKASQLQYGNMQALRELISEIGKEQPKEEVAKDEAAKDEAEQEAPAEEQEQRATEDA